MLLESCMALQCFFLGFFGDWFCVVFVKTFWVLESLLILLSLIGAFPPWEAFLAFIGFCFGVFLLGLVLMPKYC